MNDFFSRLPRFFFHFVRDRFPRFRASCIAWLALFAAPIVLGQSTEEGVVLPEVLVLSPHSRFSPNSSLCATVLDRKRLERNRARTLVDSLVSVPGVDPTSLGPSGSAQRIGLRGSSPEQVLVLLDGVRLNPAQGGGADLSLVALEGLERVEVIRGCAPSRYGSDGLGGVVNLVTRGGPPGGRLEASAGEGGLGRIAGLWRAGSDGRGWRLRASGSLGTSGSSFGYEDPVRRTRLERLNTDSRSAQAGIELSRTVATDSGSLEFSTAFDRTLSNRGAPGPAEFPTPRARISEAGRILRFSVTRRSSDPGGPFLTLEASGRRRVLSYQDPDRIPRPDSDVHASDRLETRAEAGLLLADRLDVRSSAGAWDERLDSTSDGHPRDAGLHVSAESRLLIGRFPGVPATADPASRGSLEVGGRLDDSRLFKARFAPRAGARLTLHRPTRLLLRGNAGLALRPPSFDDLFYSSSSMARGNPLLRPERSIQKDAGILFSPGAVSFSLTAFRHDVRDLIQWSPDFSGRWRPLNVIRAVLSGLEGESSWALRAGADWRADLDGSFTWMRAIDRSGQRNLDGKTLPRRPETKGGAGIRVAWRERLSAILRSRFVSFRWLDAPNVSYLPGFLAWTSGLSWSPRANLEFSLVVHNLTGVDARDLNDYPLPGRRWEWRTSVGF